MKEFKPPYYPLIPIEGGFVAIEKPILDGQYHINHKQLVKTGGGTVQYREIIAHTGIPSLKDSGLPLFEISDKLNKIAEDYAISCLFKHKGILKQAFIEGYNSAGEYTEEDMRKAIERVFSIVHNNNLLIKEDCKRIKDDTINFLKPKPITIKVEMDTVHTDHAPDGWETFPKLTDNNYLIIKEVVYE